MNKAASQLGKRAKGVSKTLTDEERARRRQSLAEVREKRWPKKQPVGRAAGAGVRRKRAATKPKAQNDQAERP